MERGGVDELYRIQGPIYSSEKDTSENICEHRYSLILEPKPKTE